MSSSPSRTSRLSKPPKTPTRPRSRSEGIRDAALRYASRGWPVLPLKPRNKTPLTPHGLLDASTEADTIRDWWTRWPDANVGLRTGIAFDVLDLDGPDAITAVNALAPGYRHTGPVSSTGKGWHLLFAPTGAKNGARLRPGLDFRGVHGYIVAPPSIHPNGHAYTWARPETLPLPESPPWLDDILFPPLPPPRPPASTDPLLAAARDRLDIVTEFRAAGADLRHRGNRYTTRCLFHPDDTPSLVIYPDTQSFFCFGCGAWGDALNLRKFLRDGSLR